TSCDSYKYVRGALLIAVIGVPRRALLRFWPESCPLHTALGLGILHESLPYVTGAGIFCHEQNDSRINTDHIRVVPVLKRIERVHETVTTPGPRIAIMNAAHHANTFLWQERQ